MKAGLTWSGFPLPGNYCNTLTSSCRQRRIYALAKTDHNTSGRSPCKCPQHRLKWVTENSRSLIRGDAFKGDRSHLPAGHASTIKCGSGTPNYGAQSPRPEENISDVSTSKATRIFKEPATMKFGTDRTAGIIVLAPDAFDGQPTRQSGRSICAGPYFSTLLFTVSWDVPDPPLMGGPNPCCNMQQANSFDPQKVSVTQTGT